MWEQILESLNMTFFMPHGHCFLWRPGILWMHVASDALIGLSYYSIPAALFYFVRKKEDIAFKGIFVLFALFIFACGTTHFMDILTTWKPRYFEEGIVKILTAGISLLTAVVLWPLIPKALQIPSPKQLEEKNAQLNELNEKLESRVEERTQELTLLSSRLKKKNDELEQFIYTISHDLKAPVVTNTSFISFLKEDIKSQNWSHVEDSLNRLERANFHMKDLIDDLLQLSRVGGTELHFEKLDLNDILRTTLDILQPQLEKRNLRVECAKPLPSIQGDRKRLVQVFENLLTNALKYASTSIEPKVIVDWKEKDEKMLIGLKDFGPGIDKKYHHKIFQLFQRLDSQEEGTGIGLTIVKKIMEVHDGEAWVESEIGQGATFWISFPTSSVIGEKE